MRVPGTLRLKVAEKCTGTLTWTTEEDRCQSWLIIGFFKAQGPRAMTRSHSCPGMTVHFVWSALDWPTLGSLSLCNHHSVIPSHNESWKMSGIFSKGFWWHFLLSTEASNRCSNKDPCLRLTISVFLLLKPLRQMSEWLSSALDGIVQDNTHQQFCNLSMFCMSWMGSLHSSAEPSTKDNMGVCHFPSQQMSIEAANQQKAHDEKEIFDWCKWWESYIEARWRAESPILKMVGGRQGKVFTSS